MWETFGADVVVALISSALTVLIAYGTFLLNRWRDQRMAAQFIIDDLAHRRAFAASAVRIPGAEKNDDYKRANASVLTARDEIRAVRPRMGADLAVQQALSSMIRSCNIYLEKSARDPDAYAIQLVELRDALGKDVRKLADKRRVRPTTPGSLAFSAPR